MEEVTVSVPENGFRRLLVQNWFCYVAAAVVIVAGGATIKTFFGRNSVVDFSSITREMAITNLIADHAFFLVSLTLIGLLKRKTSIKVNYTRKLGHYLMFNYVVYAMYTHNFADTRGAFVALAIAVVGSFLIFGGKGNLFYDALVRDSDAPYGTFFMVFPFVIGLLATQLTRAMFGDVVAVGMLVCGWGDAAGEPIGVRFGKHRYRVPSLFGVATTRSIEGSLGVLVASVIGAYVALHYAMGVGAGLALICALVAAVVGTFVEAFAPHGMDNVFMIFVPAWLVSVMLKLFGH